jgi:hypothetical protein
MFLGELINLFTNKRLTTPWTMKDLKQNKKGKWTSKVKNWLSKVLKYCKILKF